MLKWLINAGDRTAPKSQTPLDLEALKQQPTAVVFKHSSTCPVSWAAQSQVQKFTDAHPQIPVYTVVVQEDRDLSRQLAQMTGIRHESPQVIIFKNGAPVADESHEGVTAAYLAEVTG